MAQKRTVIDKFFLVIKGLAMGAANKVPGVSGGTVAFVVGFYEELIYSLQKINRKAFKLLLNGRFKSFFNYVNAPFLIFIFGGSMLSYFSVSKLLDFLIRHYETYVWSTFFGMIIGSIYYVSKDFKDWRFKNVLAIVLGISVGVLISIMEPATENDNLWFVFLCGIVGVSGMTLPGLSGSFIVMLLGNYVLLLVDSVNMLYKTMAEVVSGDFSFVNNPTRIHYLKIIGAFTAGSGFGLVVTSHILGYVLKRWHQFVTALIIGFIAGSLGTVWPFKKAVYKFVDGAIAIDANGNKIVQDYHRYIPDLGATQTWYAILYILLGVVILLFLEWYGRKNKH
jgi:putative membrane protein